MSIAERQTLTSARVTLDGRPATVIGWRNDYATVATLPDGPAYEWSWPSVAAIVAVGGRFRS